jgi:dTDP-4-dehydrorhamnose 3,5-epimerase-like enzyme
MFLKRPNNKGIWQKTRRTSETFGKRSNTVIIEHNEPMLVIVGLFLLGVFILAKLRA